MEYVKAFLFGGALCMIGQFLIDKTALTPAKILVTYVVAGVLLDAVGLYPLLIDLAGAGATVPLTGFGHLLSSGVKDAIEQDGWLGVLIGGIKNTAGGITAAMVFGYFASLLFRPKDKS